MEDVGVWAGSKVRAAMPKVAERQKTALLAKRLCGQGEIDKFKEQPPTRSRRWGGTESLKANPTFQAGYFGQLCSSLDWSGTYGQLGRKGEFS
jgi:hypothetical protein